MQDTVPEQTTRPQQMKAGPRRIPGNSLKSWVPRRLLAVKQNTFTAEVLGDHPAHHRWGQTEKNYMSPCGEATPELLSSSSHSVLHECIYPLGRCPSNAILASPGWRITCNMILPHLSLTHVPGSVGNARRAPWLLPSMFLAPCQNRDQWGLWLRGGHHEGQAAPPLWLALPTGESGSSARLSTESGIEFFQFPKF